MPLAPNLTRAREVVTSTLVDACRITWDPQGPLDDALNKATGKLTPPAGDAGTTYEGPCSVGPVSGATIPPLAEQGGEYVGVETLQLTLPWSAPKIPIGALVEMTAATDAQLAGREFRVMKPLGGTYEVSRRILIEERADAERRR